MMTTKAVEEISKAIEGYQLMSSKDLAAMRARWFRPERKEVADSEAFRKWLVVVAEAGVPNPPEDIFRLGCLFYRCVTGRPSYSEKELPTPSHPAPPVCEVAPEVRDLVFLASGSLLMLALIFLVHLLTGMRITYVAGLFTGAVASYLVEMFLRWRQPKKAGLS
jgi:hypothetical protein